MKKILSLPFIKMCGLALLFAACSPKYGAHFTPTSNNFHQPAVAVNAEQPQKTVEQPVIPESVANVEEENAVASAKPLLIPQTPKVEGVMNKYKDRVAAIKSRDLTSKEEKKILKKEKKQFVKEFTKELKTELKAKTSMKRSGFPPKQKIFVGAVVGIAGIVIAILASGSLGGLAIIVGVVLIAWGIIEQGGV